MWDPFQRALSRSDTLWAWLTLLGWALRTGECQKRWFARMMSMMRAMEQASPGKQGSAPDCTKGRRQEDQRKFPMLENPTWKTCFHFCSHSEALKVGEVAPWKITAQSSGHCGSALSVSQRLRLQLDHFLSHQIPSMPKFLPALLSWSASLGTSLAW